MVDQADAALLRRWAMQCFAQATDPRASREERAHLLKMRVGLLAMADTQDWLNGERQQQKPPRQQLQLRATG